jgi:L-ascorbate metabolism protein UlaG (beta-lactamase superfamily)
MPYSKKPKRYSNMDKVTLMPSKSLMEFLKWRKERLYKEKDLSFIVPHHTNIDLNYLRGNRTVPSVTWVGHATFLIQAGGVNIITDPVWSGRMGLDKRLSMPGITLDDLPVIDFVLISHGHYDHLHFPSLRRLKGDPRILVPAGLGSLVKRKGFHNVVEFSWWDTVQFGSVEFTFVPAQHWTSRSLWDTNRSHWGGWMIHADTSIYFAGDTGYFRGFKDIGERFEIDLALMPIGAYEPEWKMSLKHVSPEEAVKAFIDLKAKAFIPMHYGAFRIADDTPKEALDRLQTEWRKRNLPDEQLKILSLGEVFQDFSN